MTAIGIDIGGTTVKLGAVDEDAQIVYRLTSSTPKDAAALAQCVAEMVREARTVYPGAPFALSIAGSFNSEGNFDANMLNFWNVPLRQLMEAACGEPVRIENDGICALMAESVAGALKGANPGLMITLGTGVGGGVIINGKPLRGNNGTQAELGHMITHVDGKPCSCGQVGCWECYASATALSEMAGGLAPREVLEKVQKGELREVWAQYVHEIAEGLVGLCSIFSPQRIAIGGGVSNAGEFVANDINEAFHRNRGGELYYPHVRIVPAAFRNDAGILGAASLCTEQ